MVKRKKSASAQEANLIQGSEVLAQAVKILKRGGVVAYPTDTAYGFAVDATNLEAIKKLYQLKGRDFHKPIQVIFPSLAQASKYVEFKSLAKKLAKKFWPGAVSLVLPLRTKAKNWQMLSGNTGTLGVRNPNHPITQQLVKMFGRPITTTSANVSGRPSTYSVAEIKAQYRSNKLRPDFYLDGGSLTRGAISTLLRVDQQSVTLIREGVVSFKSIQKAISSK